MNKYEFTRRLAEGNLQDAIINGRTAHFRADTVFSNSKSFYSIAFFNNGETVLRIPSDSSQGTLSDQALNAIKFDLSNSITMASKERMFNYDSKFIVIITKEKIIIANKEDVEHTLLLTAGFIHNDLIPVPFAKGETYYINNNVLKYTG